MASLGEQPVTRLNTLEANYLKDAEHLIQTLPSIEETLSPSIEALNLLKDAHLVREAGQYQHAVNLYQQALGMNPQLTDAIWGKCAALNAQGQFEIASSVCYEALAIDPTHAKALWSSAEANEKMGLYEQAFEERSRALSLDPNLPASLSSTFKETQSQEPSPKDGAENESSDGALEE
jgi:tetratricopeptide (TPR) repeat protein